MPAKYYLFLVAAFVICFNLADSSAEENWNRWRGPLGTGHTTQKLPVSFNKSNINWKLELPGVGQSSPVTWENQIFLTSASKEGNQRMVFSVDANTGKMLWEKNVWSGTAEETHKMNNRASSTCVTDGKYLVAFFGKGGMHAFDLDGKLLWSKDLGVFQGPWGTAASPVIYKGLVIQNCDADDQSFMLALDLKTGNEVWRTKRPVIRGWSTPILFNSGKRDELVINGHYGINAYDPQTGEELWFCKGDNGRGTPTVTPYKDTLIAVAGRPGDMISVKAGGQGDVTNTQGVWRTKRQGTRDLPSPAVIDDYLFVASLNPGIGTMYDAATGTLLDKQRLDGSFSASPIISEGHIYIPSESGVILVIKPSEKFEIVARNDLQLPIEEVVRASLTPYQGKILMRSDKVLYCIGN